MCDIKQKKRQGLRINQKTYKNISAKNPCKLISFIISKFIKYFDSFIKCFYSN